jgi:hypothetical protein
MKRVLSWDETMYATACPGKVHALLLTRAVCNLVSKLRSEDREADLDDALWTISRIYSADESYLHWMYRGENGP